MAAKRVEQVFVAVVTTAAVAVACACCGSLASAQIQPETPTTLHVGETAAVQLRSDAEYDIGSAGRSLTLVKQMQQHDTTILVYRAVEVGDQTLVATPRDPGPDGCISCVAVRYFIRVTR